MKLLINKVFFQYPISQMEIYLSPSSQYLVFSTVIDLRVFAIDDQHLGHAPIPFPGLVLPPVVATFLFHRAFLLL